ncbi:oxysterol-binding protein-related protein 1-like isoform X2 [Convolutriloba macropyga]|uniref:oxysterol-binding protein-related protein 1-like isoform X2 n=1 Tax=Convolutriloba macropyga TaxID=536237 RepID=UPI003F51E526
MSSIYFKSTCQDFLVAARQGNVDEVEKALGDVPRSKWNHVINLPGDSKTNRNWSALQLASYFGHVDMVKFLLSHGAEVNYQNDAANTALHLAAFTKRNEIVLCLLNAGAFVHVVNSDGKTAKKMTEQYDECYSLINQAEKSFMLEQQEKLFTAVRNNSSDEIIDILNGECPPSINCKDLSGNTPLHVAANLNKHAAAVILLQNGANPSAVNNAELKPVDLTFRTSMKRLLGLKPVQTVLKDVQRFEGEILKKGMFLVKKFWVVLSRGVVTFYSHKDDSVSGMNRRGYLFLRGSTIKADTTSACLLVVKLPDRRKQYWSVSSGVDRSADLALRQKWITALQIHIDYAGRMYRKMSDLDSSADGSFRRSPKSKYNWSMGSNQNILPISSVRDSLLSSQSLVKMLSTQVSEVVSTAEALDTQAQRQSQASSGAPIMIPEMEELIMEHNQGQQNGNNSTQPNGESCSCNCSSSGYSSATNYNNGLKNGKIPAKPVTNSVTGLSAEHLKLLRQLSDTSDLSKKVMGNLEQCMLVMYQQEEYRLEQLNEANRKNEILENALRILAKQHHNLELTLNESFKSCDSKFINRFEKAVQRRNTLDGVSVATASLQMSGTATGADGDTDTHPTNNYDHHLEQDHEREEEGSGSHDQNNQPSTGMTRDVMTTPTPQNIGEVRVIGGSTEDRKDEQDGAAVIDDDDDDLFYDALSIDSNGSVRSTSEEFAALEERASNCSDEICYASLFTVSPEPFEINGHVTENGDVPVAFRTSSPQFLTSLQSSIGSAFDQPSKLATIFTDAGQTSIEFDDESVTEYRRLLIGNARQVLPAEMPKGRLLSLWETLKELLGKDLTRVSMPVLFNEPLSMLQRSAEFLESAFLLAKASNTTDQISRMVLTSTFVIINLHSLVDRLNKPFNPLLGETFQLVDDEMGYRFIAEQVSHHPPIAAFNFQSSFCQFNCNSAPIISFGGLGQSIQVRVAGNSVFRLKVEETDEEETFSWTHPKYIIHNIIAGQLWLEQNGCVTVMNHTNGCSVDIEFKPAGFFKGALHDVEAFVKDSNGIKRVYLFGKWTECIYAISVEKMAQIMEDKRRTGSLNDNLVADEDCVMVWKRAPKIDTSKYYSYTKLAFALNEIDNLSEEYIKGLPCTDSRFRPDVRHLERGELSKASEEKHRLEQKQRAARASREKLKQPWKPMWFEDQHFGMESISSDGKLTGSSAGRDSVPSQRFVFNNKYWNGDYSSCPDIF